MSIEKKFNKFSTKEWIQYLQYKLSPEREKELDMQTEKDPFLKEAVDTIGDKENRPIAYQSITYLINVIEQGTGVSESRITKTKTESPKASGATTVNPRILLGAFVGLIVLGLLAFGIYYFITHSSSSAEEQTMTEAETVSETQLYADSSAMPLEALPTGSQAKPDTIKLTNPQSSATKPIATKPAVSEDEQRTKKENTTSSSMTTTTSSTLSNRERELFNQAQEYYKQNNREEAVRILKELKSYENPMKSKAESILKNMENKQ